MPRCPGGRLRLDRDYFFMQSARWRGKEVMLTPMVCTENSMADTFRPMVCSLSTMVCSDGSMVDAGAEIVMTFKSR